MLFSLNSLKLITRVSRSTSISTLLYYPNVTNYSRARASSLTNSKLKLSSTLNSNFSGSNHCHWSTFRTRTSTTTTAIANKTKTADPEETSTLTLNNNPSPNPGRGRGHLSQSEGAETAPEVDVVEVSVDLDLDVDDDKSASAMIKVLNVAEKNDAAKRISGLLSNGRASNNPTFSKYNRAYRFPFNFRGRNCEMIFTSVSGHLLGQDFPDEYRKWQSCDPVALFDAPVVKTCPNDYKDIKRTLEQFAPQAQVLVIWTDCDREGEGIGFEVIEVCRARNPNLQILRAKFSEITPTAVNRAWRNLVDPDKRLSDAVEVRSELDLRIGAAYTRFQTMRLQKKFPVLADKLISYGSCQFPTLGFVVERYKAIMNFIPEEFWKIEVSHTIEGCSVDFNWARVRLFNKLAVQILYEKCLDNPLAKVIKVQSKPKSKWRPVALDTVEFEKLSSRKLRINAKEAMRIAEKLYTAGIISYPRTETNIFPQGLDLNPLIDAQTASNQWGRFAERLLQTGVTPRNGKSTDQAHPPIHPTKFDANLTGPEAKIYELIVRHFLACCSKDAIGKETTVEIEIADERFIGHGLQVIERNYLEVYIYDKWSDKELPAFREGETFRPTRMEMTESQTSPPNLLTEADLISLMEKHGIGTDATHADHIETIKQRMYVGLQNDGFVPGQLGMGLVDGYDAMGFEMSKPNLRAEFEADLKAICEGRKDPKLVLQQQVRKYKEVFIAAVDQANRLDSAIAKCLDVNQANAPRAPGNGPAGRQPGAGGNNRRGGGGGLNDDDDDDDPPGPGRGGGGAGGSSRGGGPRPPPAGGSGANYSSTRSGAGAGAGASNFTNGIGSGFGNSNSNANNPRPKITFPKPPPKNMPPPPARTPIPTPTARPLVIFCDCENPKRLPVKTVKMGKMMGRPFYTCEDCGFHKFGDDKSLSEYNSADVQSHFRNSSPGPSPSPARSTSRNPQSTSSSRKPPQSRYLNRNQNQYSDPEIDEDEDPEPESEFPQCNCGMPAKSLTVKKDGPNKGRLFFGCPKPYGGDDKCQFFQWDDAGIGARSQFQPNSSSRFNQPGSSSSGLGNMGFSSNRGAGGSRGTGGKRGRGGGAGGGKGTGGPRKCSVCKETGHTKRSCPVAAMAELADEDEEMFE